MLQKIIETSDLISHPRITGDWIERPLTKYQVKPQKNRKNINSIPLKIADAKVFQQVEELSSTR